MLKNVTPCSYNVYDKQCLLSPITVSSCKNDLFTYGPEVQNNLQTFLYISNIILKISNITICYSVVIRHSLKNIYKGI